MGKSLQEIFGGFEGVQKTAAAQSMQKTASENEINAVAYGLAKAAMQKTAQDVFQAKRKKVMQKQAELALYTGFDKPAMMIKEAFDRGYSAEQIAKTLIKNGANPNETITKVAGVEEYLEKVAEGRLLARGFVAELMKFAQEALDAASNTEGMTPEDATRPEQGEMEVGGDSTDSPETFPNPTSADQLDKGNTTSAAGGLSALVANAQAIAENVGGATKSFTIPA